MLIIDQSAAIVNYTEGASALIERAGRTCYKSEPTGDSAEFISMIMEKRHFSVIEHANVTVHFVTDRGVTHELVRHRLAAYSQESTRWCNYGKRKFGRQVTFIRPVWISHNELEAELMSDSNVSDISDPVSMWYAACKFSEEMYMYLLDAGWKPQQARSVLNNSLKTEIIMTANFREWLHVFEQRCSPDAHPQMQELMRELLTHFRSLWPTIFNRVRLEDDTSPVVG